MKKFVKKQEDFTCEKCGYQTKGTGYTNHCPKCFWSKHVDANPGDRQSDCRGMMKPIDIYFQNQNWIIIHQCEDCGCQSKNKIRPEDDFNELIRLEEEINQKKIKG